MARTEEAPEASPVHQHRSERAESAAADSALHHTTSYSSSSSSAPTAPSAGQDVQGPLAPPQSDSEGQSEDENEEDILSPEEYAAEMEAKQLLIADVPAVFQSTMQRTPKAVLQRKLEWLQKRMQDLEETFRVMNRPSNLLSVDSEARRAVRDELFKRIDQIEAADWLLDEI